MINQNSFHQKMKDNIFINVCLLSLTLLVMFVVVTRSLKTETFSNETSKYVININIPQDIPIKKDDEYLCTIKQLNISQSSVYIIEVTYNFKKERVHHVLLYGCKSVSKYFLENKYWPCGLQGRGNMCSGRKQIPLGISSKDSTENMKSTSSTKFPTDVGYGIGSKFNINFIMMEMHFIGGIRNISHSNEQSGVIIGASLRKPKYLSGMIVMAGVGFRIPPHREKYSINVNCQPRISQPIFPYAYWVHTHELGKVVSGYKVKVNGMIENFTEIARWTHHWPQPVVLTNVTEGERQNNKLSINITPGDFLAAKCTYDSSKMDSYVNWGPRKKLDEMCNLFIFYYTLSVNPNDLSITCINEFSKRISEHFPNNSDTLPINMSSKFNNSISTAEFKSTTNFSPICRLYKMVGINYCPFE